MQKQNLHTCITIFISSWHFLNFYFFQVVNNKCMTKSNDCNELFNKSLLNNLFAVYKRRPLRPPFLLVLSDGMGVTSSVNIIKTFNKHFICMELTMTFFCVPFPSQKISPIIWYFEVFFYDAAYGYIFNYYGL